MIFVILLKILLVFLLKSSIFYLLQILFERFFQ